MVELWWSSWVPSLAPYAILLSELVRGAISADEFEVVFLRLYKLDPTEWSPEVFDVLESLFAGVDDYCADATLREKVGGLDADALRRHCALALEQLRELGG